MVFLHADSIDLADDIFEKCQTSQAQSVLCFRKKNLDFDLGFPEENCFDPSIQ